MTKEGLKYQTALHQSPIPLKIYEQASASSATEQSRLWDTLFGSDRYQGFTNQYIALTEAALAGTLSPQQITQWEILDGLMLVEFKNIMGHLPIPTTDLRPRYIKKRSKFIPLTP